MIFIQSFVESRAECVVDDKLNKLPEFPISYLRCKSLEKPNTQMIGNCRRLANCPHNWKGYLALLFSIWSKLEGRNHTLQGASFDRADLFAEKSQETWICSSYLPLKKRILCACVSEIFWRKQILSSCLRWFAVKIFFLEIMACAIFKFYFGCKLFRQLMKCVCTHTFCPCKKNQKRKECNNKSKPTWTGVIRTRSIARVG